MASKRHESGELKPSEAELLIHSSGSRILVIASASIRACVSESKHVHVDDMIDGAAKTFPVAVLRLNCIGCVSSRGCESGFGKDKLSLILEVSEVLHSSCCRLDHRMSIEVVHIILSVTA